MFGAIVDQSGTLFGVWAPDHREAEVVVTGKGSFSLSPQGKGYFAGHVPGVTAGDRYMFRLDGGAPVPDLASRWQPDGNDGPSVVVSDSFKWTDGDWPGPSASDEVIYELHIGTFTPEGTWPGALEKLEALKALGVTIVQVMPIGTFKGAFGWGYDTTLPYAPFAPYGSPDDMRRFVDTAHALGIAVILDVVYNHVGLGDHFRAYGEQFFTKRHESEWGASFNYDDYENGASAVRDFIVGNAVYWIEAFHVDGLRLDAVQAMIDDSDEHVVAAITRAVRTAAAPRTAYMVVENQPQERLMIERPEQGGMGVDAMYSDDFQHAVRVAATGHNDFYYRDYLGTPQELISALKYGFLYQGQRSDMRDAAYGTYNLDTPAQRFVHFLENHDQVANSATGARLGALMAPARLRAITALLLLGPQTPCLFQGQEFASSNPFLYFFGIDGEEAESVATGRRQSVSNFPSVVDPVMQNLLARPDDRSTFVRSKLDWAEAESNAPILALHRDLLQMRREDPSFSQTSERRIDGAVLGDAALVIRVTTHDPSGHRLLLINLGRDHNMGVTAEPLLAPPPGHRWMPYWSSEHPDYGGAGRRPMDAAAYWILPADCTLVLKPQA
ncbi:malto-oligosyltrehalose trehalohydrolase [Devosia lucknowensis]|nr:malto-oligosyltrehalose trehalohydrolase [Devosia lucknowensis]